MDKFKIEGQEEEYIIDAVIPAHIKDVDTLDLCIQSIKEHVKGIRNVHVVSKEKLTDEAIWVPEDSFPFTLKDVANIIGAHWRTGWYYADLLEFLSAILIPDLSEHVLICDSDTIFLEPHRFVVKGPDGNGKSIFNVGFDVPCRYVMPEPFRYPDPNDPSRQFEIKWINIEMVDGGLINTNMTHFKNSEEMWQWLWAPDYNTKNPYFEYMKRIVPGLEKQTKFCAVVHHMPMQKTILKELVDKVEKEQEKPFWQFALETVLEDYDTVNNIEIKDAPGKMCGYDLYFNYAFQFHPALVAAQPKKSILAYKGKLGVADMPNDVSHPSRSNLYGKYPILTPSEEELLNFETPKEAIRHLADRCKELGWSAVTFQNHSRITPEKHRQESAEYIKSLDEK
tara:strand:+ start:10003 stop:11187 length:1185 start_codon:yes stop_codon:yes gene_type:complete